MRKLVDWHAVQTELNELPAEFKQESFDSLSRVIDILGAVDPSQALKELQEKQERIELLVDDIVKEYHVGFNKSIHNYSEILQLFSEAQSQVKSIRSSLVSSKKQLGSRTETLKRQWVRSKVLNESIKLLDDIEYVAHVPEKVAKLCASSKYKDAVNLLIDAENRLGEKGLNQVKALLDLQNVLQDHKKTTRGMILGDLSSHLFATTVSNGNGVQNGQSPIKQELLERSESLDSLHEENTIDELVKSLCLLDPDARFLGDIADGFRSTLEKVIVAFLKDLRPFDFKGDSSKYESKLKPQLFNSNIVEHARQCFRKLCVVLAYIFERHFELGNLVLKAGISTGKNMNLSPEWHVTMQRFADAMQEECIRLLCNLLDRQEPDEIHKAASESIDANLVDRPSIRTNSMIHKSHALKFRFNNTDVRNEFLSFPSRKDGQKKYKEYIGRIFGKENLGSHVVVALYSPCQDLINVMEGRMLKPSKNLKGPWKMMQFLEDHVLETFIPSIRSLCKTKLQQILSSKAPKHKRSYSRDKFAISNGQNEEMLLVKTVIQQNLEYAQAMPKFISHFSVIIEAMLIKYFESSEKLSALFECTLASKLAMRDEIVLLMSLEQCAFSYLDNDYFHTQYQKDKYKALKGEEKLLMEMRDLRPLSAENLSDSLASYESTAKSANSMEEILNLIKEFMESCKADKNSPFPTDGLATVSKEIKGKSGNLLRTLRLELRLKVTAALQHLENFSVVANLGCESFDRSLNTAVIDENCSPYVIIILQSLKQCSDVLFNSVSKKYYNYIFDGIDEFIMDHLKQYLFKLDFTNASRINIIAEDIKVLQQAIASNSFFQLYKKKDSTFTSCTVYCQLMVLPSDSIISYLESNKKDLRATQLNNLVSLCLRRVDLPENNRKQLEAFVDNNVD